MQASRQSKRGTTVTLKFLKQNIARVAFTTHISLHPKWKTNRVILKMFFLCLFFVLCLV